MKNHKLFFTCIFSIFLAAPAAVARQFINANFEVQMFYSNFNQGTIPAGRIAGTIRRTDDHFACALTVNMTSYKCQTRAAVDQLAWMSVNLADFGTIVSSAIDPRLPKMTAERIRAILRSYLKSPLLITGVGYVFKNPMQVYGGENSDVLNLIIKIY